MKRIINLDWIEVYCIEPKSHWCDAEHFLLNGWEVNVRDHGTPQYKEMFTLCDPETHVEQIEVRRNPYSVKSPGNPDGLFLPGSCHIRLSNRLCYCANPIGFLQMFLDSNGYDFQGISRIDLCLDFQIFDSGDLPSKFISRYMAGRYRKLSQINLFSHANYTNKWVGARYNFLRAQAKELAQFVKSGNLEDSAAVEKLLRGSVSKLNAEAKRVAARFVEEENAHAIDHDLEGIVCSEEDFADIVKDYNYVSWRSDNSPVSVKLYNKTLELDREGHYKRWIEQQWRPAYEDGTFTDDLDVYRLEFSLKSSCKGFIQVDGAGEQTTLANDLDTYKDKASIIKMFQCLVSRYFKFVHTEVTREGNLQRKARSTEKTLFWFYPSDYTYHNIQPTTKHTPGRKFNLVMNALTDIQTNPNYCLTSQEVLTIQKIKRSLADFYLFKTNYDYTLTDALSYKKQQLTDDQQAIVNHHYEAIKSIIIGNEDHSQSLDFTNADYNDSVRQSIADMQDHIESIEKVVTDARIKELEIQQGYFTSDEFFQPLGDPDDDRPF